MSALEFTFVGYSYDYFVLLASSVLLREEKVIMECYWAFTTPMRQGRTAAAKLAAVLLSLLACVCALFM